MSLSIRDNPCAPRRMWAIGPVHPDNVTSAGIMLQRIYADLPETVLDYVFVSDDALIQVQSPRAGSRFRSLLRILGAPLLQISALFKQKQRVESVVDHINSRGGADLIIGNTGSVSSLPLANAVAKRMNVPVILHLFDHPVDQWMNPFSRVIARRTVAPVLADADAICCTNEIMASEAEVMADGKVEKLVILRNPVPDELVLDRENQPSNPSGEERVLVYTGSAYDAQLGSIRAFVQAVGCLRERGVAIRMDIYSRMPRDRYHLLGCPSPGITIFDAVDTEQAIQAQQSADLLALPLSFHSRYPEKLILTSAPGKLAEYLASGTPVVVHAPKGSFPSVFCRGERCAIVADEPSVEGLADRMMEALDKRRSEELVDRAWRIAESEFTQSKVSSRAVELINGL